MTTSKNSATKQATKQAKAVETEGVPALAKAQLTKLASYADHFKAMHNSTLESANAQRLDLMAMSELGSWEQCWPTLEALMGTVWSEVTMRVSKSFLKRYWTARSNGIAFPAVEGTVGWQAYAKDGALSDALKEAGLVKARAPSAGGSDKALAKAKEEVAAAKPEAKTIAKGADSAADILKIMAELANRLSTLTDSKIALGALGTLRDDLEDIKTLMVK